jgi:hypothetical protein
MSKHKVTGLAPIVGVDGVAVVQGTVELDPAVTNIGALVESGLVEPAQPAKTEPKPKDE